MAIPTFNPTPKPSPGTEDKPEIKILKADFGDGYTQSAPNGINPVRRILNLNWETLLPAQAETFKAFFAGQLGCLPFWYTPSDESTPIKWTCEEWSDKRGDGGLRSFSAVLKQTFNLAT